MKMNPAAKYSWLAVLFFAAAFLAGCVAPQPVDWNSRVGHYTYHQAVSELGLPNRLTRRSDGTTVAKWFTQPGGADFGPGMPNGLNNGANNGFGGGPNSASQNLRPGFSDHYLQLTFGTNDLLSAWSNHE